ncbi:enoyl-CoA hydratase/isomerase family protein [Bacillus shihchuchen]
MTEHVLFSVSKNGVASITLNRPKALNSLSYDMLQPIGQKLKEWENDERIEIIILKVLAQKVFVQVATLKLFMKHVQMKLHCSMRNVFLKRSMKLIHIFINIKTDYRLFRWNCNGWWCWSYKWCEISNCN